MTGLADRIEQALGRRPSRIAPLGGGCIAPVHRCDFAGGDSIVAKQPSPGRNLDCEAWMLRYLAAKTALPVPAVLAAAPDLLLLAYIDSGDAMAPAAEAHLAELLAALHAIRGPHFGFARDTVIGPLDQINVPSANWLAFFRDRRLLHRARAAQERGRLPARLLGRIETLAARLDRWIDAPAHPALIHGDCWSGNVLVRGGRVAGLIDPALYWADPEIELAFGTLFGPMGDAFFRRYGEIAPLRPGFFEARRDLYNLYPLLVHTELFGGAYAAEVARTLDRFGV
ncbi:MAG: fructosamine kinase family protein [Rhodospirillaceae bacterium]|nr:fructosamine kinase family protein [Rhodospirillaceae bacterium]